MRRALLLVAGLALGACATDYPVYYRSGVAASESEPDAYECIRDAKALGGSAYIGFGVTERTVDWNMYHMCMRTRGWQLMQRGSR